MTISLETFYLIIALGIIILALGGFFLWFLNFRRNQTNKNLELDIIKIKIPKYTKNEKDELSREYVQNSLGQIENFFAALSGLKAQKKIMSNRTDTFSIEMVALNGQISFYAAIPHQYHDFFIQQLQAVYPKVYFEATNDYNIFSPYGQISGGSLRFAKTYSLPIRTYKSFDSDPLESITNSLSKLGADEAASIQYVFRSAPKSWHNQGLKIVREMYKGANFSQAVRRVDSSGFGNKVGKVFGFFGSFLKTTKPEEEKKKDLEQKHQ